MMRQALVVLASLSIVSLPAGISYRYGTAFQQESFGDTMLMFSLEYIFIAFMVAIALIIWILVLGGCVTLAKDIGFLEEKK